MGSRKKVTVNAARSGHLDCLRNAFKRNYPLKIVTCARAAEYGNLECLQLARYLGSPWDSRVCVHAAKNGHLKCLEWSIDNGCPWKGGGIMFAACKWGHLNIVTWIRERGYLIFGIVTRRIIYDIGHIEIIKYMIHQGYKPNKYDWRAALHGANINIIKFLDDSEVEMVALHSSDFNNAIQKKSVECIIWLYEHQCPVDSKCFKIAALTNNLDIIKLLYTLNYQWDEDVCTIAAVNNNLDIIIWARSMGCKWNGNIYIAAIMYNHTKILRWAIENHCPEIDFYCYKDYIYDNYIIEFCKILTEKIIKNVIRENAKSIIIKKWLSCYYTPGNFIWKRRMNHQFQLLTSQ